MRRTLILGADDEVVSVLAHWLRAWDEATQEAKDLRTQFSAANLLATVSDLLAHAKPYGATIDLADKGLTARMLRELREAIAHADAGIALLRMSHPREVEDLQAALSGRVAVRGLVRDLVRPLTAAMDDALALVRVALSEHIPSLVSQAADTGWFDSEILEESARLCARSLLLLVDAKSHKKWVSTRLSLGAFRVVRRRASPTEMDAAHAAARDASVRDLARCLLDVGFRERVVSEVDSPLDYPDLVAAADALVRARRDPLSATTELARRLVARVAATGVAYGLRPSFHTEPVSERRSWQAVQVLAAESSPALGSAALVETEEDLLAINAFTADAASAFVREAVGEAAAMRFAAACPELVASLHGWVATHFAATLAHSDRDVLWHVAAREVHSALHEWLRRSHSAIGDAIENELHALAAGRNELWSKPEALEAWNAALETTADRSESIWRAMPWDTFNSAELLAALEPLGSAFQTTRVFDVVLAVRGADFKGDAWQAGRLTAYRPMTHSLGEYVVSSDQQSASAAEIHVLQRVLARSVKSAVAAATSVLEPALSTLVFALSVGESHSGFRPSVASRYFVGDPARGDATGWGGWHRTERPSHEVGLSLLQQYADVYAPVIERLADRTARTDLEARFLRALFWYRSGRWQPNPTRRFLDHFVALEHLFTARSAGKAEPLANGVGRLFGSWMFRRGYFGIHISRTIRVAKSLWNSVAADPTLAEGVRDVADKLAGKVRKVDHWHSHVGPWLSPTFVGAVSDALPAERRSAEWGAHLLALTQLREGEARWRDRDESRAHSGWFLVHRLALRRNAIVHDAMTELPGADHEADALTSVVERVLMHIVEDLLTRPNVAHSMDDLLDELPAPWLE